jgi:hypothetical protein
MSETLEAHVEAEACPHLAVFLRNEGELPGVLASFYALAVARGGWLAHRSLPGGADRERAVLTDAGCDVARLEADGQMVVVEMDFSAPPENSARPWEPLLDDALERGHTGLWYARFPVGGGAEYEAMMGFERAWHDTFRDRPVVTICPFIVGDLDGGAAIATLGEVAAVHTGVLLPRAGGGYGVLRPG